MGAARWLVWRKKSLVGVAKGKQKANNRNTSRKNIYIGQRARRQKKIILEEWCCGVGGMGEEIELTPYHRR